MCARSPHSNGKAAGRKKVRQLLKDDEQKLSEYPLFQCRTDTRMTQVSDISSCAIHQPFTPTATSDLAAAKFFAALFV